VLADLRSPQAIADLELRQAAFVATRVISCANGRITLDAGSKALAPDRPATSNLVLGWPGLAPSTASEEHLVVQVASGAEVPALGELVIVVPDHVCTTVNLYRRALLLRAGAIAGEAAIEAAGHRLWLTGADA
jgi:D-serine deaminase-like pyridoxal phosphate-dependent protein